ncbi:MAG: prephenate dehydrogenase/arogenate dehydrogenase family protein [Chloroflexi bacterium]|nr:prephenate dehydrogenase/arogenate dehydrogenase family protein [Chloroflexota bacterium]
MTVQITVIGLGQIGTSIGLSLAKYPERIKRIGYDRALETQNKAKGLGAFDAVKFNLPTAIEGADVVALCIPLDQVDETFRLIAPDLREDAVVLDFSSQKSAAHQWFEKRIPAGRHYIGLVPSVNPDALEQTEYGIEAARPDLFEGATVGIAAPAGTSSQALKLASDLVELLGAQRIFLDMLEADGMTMTAHLLPQIISAALLNATVGQPGWAEARRFAGRPFAQATAALGTDTLEALTQALLHNPLGATSVLDNAIGALTHLRAAIEKGDQADLQKRLDMALTDREKWLNERLRADWGASMEKPEPPKSGDILKRIFLGSRQKENKK